MIRKNLFKKRKPEKAVELANKARLDSINNERFKVEKEEEERCEKLLTPEYLANWVGASFFTKENIEKDCGVYPSAYSGGKCFITFLNVLLLWSSPKTSKSVYI